MRNWLLAILAILAMYFAVTHTIKEAVDHPTYKIYKVELKGGIRLGLMANACGEVKKRPELFGCIVDYIPTLMVRKDQVVSFEEIK